MEIDSHSDGAQRLEALEAQIIACRLCPRLVTYREKIGQEKRRAYRDQEYWARPVPGFGESSARVLVVGLAPGAHGSNRTGRMFTGDESGVFLYRALHRFGFASQATALDRNDGLQVKDVFISSVCHCAPPANKPTREEQETCLPYLAAEWELLEHLEGIVALGRIGFEGVKVLLEKKGRPIPEVVFGHNRHYPLGDGFPWLITSYHPSRQNTQTKRLTEPMFDEVWSRVKELLA